MRNYGLIISFIFVLLFCLPIYAEDDEASKERREGKLDLIFNSLDTTNEMLFEQNTYKLVRMGERIVPRLIKELRNKDNSKKNHMNVIYILGRMGKNAKEAVPSILPFLRDRDSDFRAVAAIALGKMGKYAIDAVDELAKIRDDRNKWVRKSVYEALEKIGEREVTEELGDNRAQNAQDVKGK